MSSPPPWEVLSSGELGDYYIFRLRKDVRVSPRTGRPLNFYVLESPDWVNVIPITPEGDIILVRQFRHGTNQSSLEIPGGMVDPGEDPVAAARRELAEETGYIADELIPLGVISPNPAFMNNRLYTYLATNVRPTGRQDLGEGEDITIERIRATDVPAYIADGRIDHALVIAGFYFYHCLSNERTP